MRPGMILVHQFIAGAIEVAVGAVLVLDPQLPVY